MKKKKNEEAIFYHRLYEKHIKALFSYGMAFGLDKETVQDIIHDLFLDFIEKKLFFHEPNDLKAYLFRSLKNKIISFLRKGDKIKTLSGDEEYPFIYTVTESEVIVEEEEIRALRTRIDQFMSCLTDRQREAIHLRFLLEMSYEEVADIMHLTINGTKKLISRATLRIRNLFFFL